MRYRITVILILAAVFFTKAQDNGFFDQIWLDEGLSQSSITNITQDNQGYVWFGTQDGLNRYDGKQIDHFNFQPFNPASISGDNISDIAADSLGNIWVLNTTGALDRLNLKTFKATHVSEILKINPGDRRFILKIWLLNNRVFLSTINGFCELNTHNDSFQLNYFKFNRPRNNTNTLLIYSACSDPTGNLFVGSNEGVYSSARGLKTFDYFDKRSKEDSLNKACRVIFYRNTTLYFSQNNLFYSFNRATDALNTFSIGERSLGVISSGLMDNRNNIWLGTASNGVFVLSETKTGGLQEEKHFTDNQSIKYGLKCNFINCLYQSKHPNEDIVWIGSRDAGVFSYSYSKNSFQLVSSVLKEEQPSFFSIVKDKENVVWSGTYAGIYKIDRANESYSLIDLSRIIPNNRPVDALLCDKDDAVWVAAANSLYQINKKNNSLIPAAEQIFPEKRTLIIHLIAINNDSLLIGANTGLAVYSKKTGATKVLDPIKIKDTTTKIVGVRTMFIDSKKNWWIGTDAGLIFIDKKTNKNRFYNYDPANKESMLASISMDINEDKSGNILVATTKGISSIKDPVSGKFENFYIQQGLTNNFIYGLLADKQGKFWMSTNYGISVFDPEKKQFRSYRGSDGVFINEFNYSGFYASADGELLFGGLGGLVSLYPEQLVKNVLPPVVRLRSFKINQKSSDSLLLVNTRFRFKHNQNDIYFEFSVPDFSGKNRTKLLYKLNGGEKSGWVELNDLYSLSLANLAPGTYGLEVKAVNPDGIESERSFTLNFIIEPPFWQTWWFYFLMVLLLIGISYLIYRNRLRNKIEHLKEIESIRQEENEKVRKAAALDLHDEFGNGLTRISMLVEMAKIKMPKDGGESLQFLNIISENSSRLYQGTKDFIWSINPGNDNLFEIIIRIKDFGDELFYGTGINFEVVGLNEELKKLKQLPGTGRNIAMIYKEALSNIMKHAKATKVKLTIEQSSSEIILLLQDNGKGFDQKENKNSFGISNMNQRASRIGAHIKIRSEISKGSEIELNLTKNYWQ